MFHAQYTDKPWDAGERNALIACNKVTRNWNRVEEVWLNPPKEHQAAKGPKLQGCLINGRDNFLDKQRLTKCNVYPGYFPEYTSEMTGYLGSPSDLTLFQGVDSGW